MSEFFTNLFMSLVTGGYMGLVVSKAVAFSAVKKEVLRIIRGVDYMEEYSNTDKVRDLVILASEMLGLGHRKAGDILCKISNDANREISNPTIKNGIGGKMFDDMQREVRKLRPSTWALLNPFKLNL
ncbi:hypothetical protein [Serratia liquefaciens]|uniref:hypothetical protein n=1 Tax=Serratia liquefaciens TaxID=614 RepID=UPI0021C57F8F|nr:hypothetical protein [Serratia liquefaciens]